MGNSELKDDLFLAKRAGAGDETAFAALYDRHSDHIYNYCYRITSSPDDAADATQQSFLTMLERLPKSAGEIKNFQAYLFTIARNECYRGIARTKRTRPVEDVSLVGSSGPNNDDDNRKRVDEQPETAALIEDQQNRVRAANAKLPERQREVLALREVEGFSYAEIAALMDMSENSVAQLISRARISLRKELQSDALKSIAAASKECGEVLPLVARQQDREKMGEEQRKLVEGHLATCEHCAACSEAMQEAGTSYRAWTPLVPLLVLRDATMAQASEILARNAEQAAASTVTPDFFARHKVSLVAGTGALAVLIAVVLAGSLDRGTSKQGERTVAAEEVSANERTVTTTQNGKEVVKVTPITTTAPQVTTSTVSTSGPAVQTPVKKTDKNKSTRRQEAAVKTTPRKQRTEKKTNAVTPTPTQTAVAAPPVTTETPAAVPTAPAPAETTIVTSTTPPVTTEAPPTTTACPRVSASGHCY